MPLGKELVKIQMRAGVFTSSWGPNPMSVMHEIDRLCGEHAYEHIPDPMDQMQRQTCFSKVILSEIQFLRAFRIWLLYLVNGRVYKRQRYC